MLTTHINSEISTADSPTEAPSAQGFIASDSPCILWGWAAQQTCRVVTWPTHIELHICRASLPRESTCQLPISAGHDQSCCRETDGALWSHGHCSASQSWKDFPIHCSVSYFFLSFKAQLKGYSLWEALHLVIRTLLVENGCCLVTQSCPTLCNPMDYTVHGIL